MNPMGKVSGSSLIQNCGCCLCESMLFVCVCIFGHALTVCMYVCVCVSDCIPMGLCLNVLFESVCDCVLHAAM